MCVFVLFFGSLTICHHAVHAALMITTYFVFRFLLSLSMVYEYSKVIVFTRCTIFSVWSWWWLQWCRVNWNENLQSDAGKKGISAFKKNQKTLTSRRHAEIRVKLRSWKENWTKCKEEKTKKRSTSYKTRFWICMCPALTMVCAKVLWDVVHHRTQFQNSNYH